MFLGFSGGLLADGAGGKGTGILSRCFALWIAHTYQSPAKDVECDCFSSVDYGRRASRNISGEVDGLG